MVNNAGIAKTFPFIDFPLDNWEATVNVNITGTLLCSQRAARLMVPMRWGRIVNIASVVGMRAVGKGRTEITLFEWRLGQIRAAGGGCLTRSSHGPERRCKSTLNGAGGARCRRPRKNAAISAASALGCSIAAKCPPLTIGVQR